MKRFTNTRSTFSPVSYPKTHVYCIGGIAKLKQCFTHKKFYRQYLIAYRASDYLLCKISLDSLGRSVLFCFGGDKVTISNSSAASDHVLTQWASKESLEIDIILLA